MTKFAVLVFALFLLGCSSPVVLEKTQRDLDHQVQYSQKQLDEHTYQLSVHRLNKARFQRMSVFMLRRAYELCNAYGFNIEVVDGVELYDDRRKMPNRIFSSLEVIVHCPKK